MNLKKGNQVKILSGKDKGKTGEILEINRKIEKVKILIMHHPNLIDSKMLQENDLILHGHTHLYRNEKKDKMHPEDLKNLETSIKVIDLYGLNYDSKNN